MAQDLTGLNDPPAFGEMTMGPDTAKVTVIEYASATCPHCAAFYNDTFGALKKEYIDTGKIHFVFREFPHQDAALAAFMLARCAPKEKYFPLIDVFFATQAGMDAGSAGRAQQDCPAGGLHQGKFRSLHEE